LEADSLPVPVRLTEGQATADVVKLSREQNLRGSQPEFARRFNEQNKQLVDNVPLIRERAAPDVYATKTIESSEALINAYKALDDTRNVEISAAYKALEDANGGQFPVDGQAIVRNADAMLAKKLKTNFVPPEIAADLKRFREGEPMTFEQCGAMRTNLAAEIRKAERSGDGNAAIAASIVREALVTSVTCTPPSQPPVRFHTSHVSTVPISAAPRFAALLSVVNVYVIGLSVLGVANLGGLILQILKP
jgi:hypothetical protein